MAITCTRACLDYVIEHPEFEANNRIPENVWQMLRKTTIYEKERRQDPSYKPPKTDNYLLEALKRLLLRVDRFANEDGNNPVFLSSERAAARRAIAKTEKAF
ncbi:hypothetical protein ES703_119235 [subsurface metagenome]